MTKVNVLIDDFTKRKDLVNILDHLNVHAFLEQETGTIDARSLIGVMSISSAHPVSLAIHENNEVSDRVVRKIRQFIV